MAVVYIEPWRAGINFGFANVQCPRMLGLSNTVWKASCFILFAICMYSLVLSPVGTVRIDTQQLPFKFEPDIVSVIVRVNNYLTSY